MTDTINGFKLPPHLGGLHIMHNDHKANYRTVAEAIEFKDHGTCTEDWISPEQRQKAIDTDSMWTIQWYPRTPVGFNVRSACDLDVLLADVCEQDSQD